MKVKILHNCEIGIQELQIESPANKLRVCHITKSPGLQAVLVLARMTKITVNLSRKQ